MNPRKQAEHALKEAGLKFLREGANHDLWIDPLTAEMIPLSRSSHFDENDLKMIRSEIRDILRRRGAGRRK